MQKQLPQEGDRLVSIKLRGGKPELGRVLTVHTRNGFKLSDAEYGLYDGCRHHIDNLWPCKAMSLPTDCPWMIATDATPSFMVRMDDIAVATVDLIQQYTKSAITVAEELDAGAARLKQSVSIAQYHLA
jgi:hypothetical protein